ncbi:MAG: VTT domain-containing protein [archaeon]
MFQTLIDLFLHLDAYLIGVVIKYGLLAYPILFVVIFLETGVVVTPFLPGDSLIFVAGALSSQGLLSFFWLFITLSVAAILGDSVNYFIGKFLGGKVKHLKFINEEHIGKTEKFYEQHGGKTLIIARFIPIVRTFAPFIAGVGKMKYSRFFGYNVFGGLLWVAIFLSLGFFFGNFPFVKENLSAFIIFIVLLSFVPGLYKLIESNLKKMFKKK